MSTEESSHSCIEGVIRTKASWQVLEIECKCEDRISEIGDLECTYEIAG
jgi:hypothetical protein